MNGLSISTLTLETSLIRRGTPGKDIHNMTTDERNLELVDDYSEKSIVIFAPDNRIPVLWTTHMLKAGGRYSYDLGDRSGWVFVKAKLKDVKYLLDGIRCGDIDPEGKDRVEYERQVKKFGVRLAYQSSGSGSANKDVSSRKKSAKDRESSERSKSPEVRVSRSNRDTSPERGTTANTSPERESTRRKRDDTGIDILSKHKKESARSERETVDGPISMQTVTYEVVRPVMRQRLVIDGEDGNQAHGKVTRVYENEDGIIDTIDIDIGSDEPDKMKIINGKWKLVGYDPHTVKFM